MKPKQLEAEPSNLAEHVRVRRRNLGLTQAQAALRMGVSEWTVHNWENAKAVIPVQAIQAIVRFLGYEPFPAPRTLSERMLAKRRRMGWSVNKAARRLGVDPGTWAAWERQGAVRWPRYREILDRFLAEGV